jgi:hypothetical protein
MFNTIRNPILLFFLSYLGVMFGIGFKIMHWPGGSLTIGSMIMVQAISIIWLIVIVVTKKK